MATGAAAMVVGSNSSRALLAATAIIPQSLNETGSGHLCANFNASDPNITLTTTWYQINCITTYTVDSQIFLTMWTTAAVGALCVAVFCWGQSFVSVYRGRLLSPSVAIKPPVFSASGFFAKYFGWLWVTIAMNESELLATAGMDALMLERLIVFCLQFMAPVMVISVSALIPIHLSSNFLGEHTAEGQAVSQSNLMALTMGNLKPEAKTLWVHFTFVFLYTAYGMWLLDQHYKSYVLLRQQYLTHGDSVSAWLGPNHKLKTRPLASYGSMLLDQPTQQELFNPLWTFARAKASDSDADTRGLPSSAASTQAAAPAGGAFATAAAAATAAGGGDGAAGAAAAQPGAAVLSTLTSVAERGGGTDAALLQEQQQQQQQQLGLRQADDSADSQLPAAGKGAAAAAAPAPAPARPQIDASPFAVSGHSALQGRETLQMVQLSEVIFPVQSEAPGLQSAQHSDLLGPLPQQTTGAAGSGPGVPDRSTAPSPAESDSVAGSRLMSRQSSGRALLAGKHLDSSSAGAGLLAAESGSSPQRTTEPLESAAGAVSHSGGGGRVRRRFSGCAPGGGCGWRRLDDGPSTEEDAAAAAPYGDSQRQQEREQRRMAARAAEKAAARRAAQQLGVDLPWWQFKTGDLLLDRHVVKVDMEQELDCSAGQRPDRPYFWWELAPTDAFSSTGLDGDPSSSEAGGKSAAAGAGGSSSSNLVSVPNTSLLFDKRSLRARRPSVRFRNTVHVRRQDGGLMPLHVSNYAVLVTDVPDVPSMQRSLSSTSAASSSGFMPGRSLCGPFAEACASVLGVLDHALQCLCWGWPCLLSRSELRDYAKVWIQLSFKTAQHMSFISRQATEDVPEQLDHLEAGVLLQQAAVDTDSTVQSAAPQQQQMQAQAQAQGQRSLSAWALNNKPTTRQALVEATFKQLFPEDVQAVIPAQEYKAVNELLREWNRKVQVYIHAVALLDLKRQRQQHKRKEKQRQAQADAAAAAGGGAAAAAGQAQQAVTDAAQVSIEITSMQDKAAPVAAGSSAQPSSSSGAALNGNRSSSDIMRQGPQDAPQPSAMARPGRHSHGSSRCGSDFSDLSDSEDELDCCTAAMRKLCCCRCCSVGAIQDGGHGLTAPGADDMGLDAAAGSGHGRCWGLFGRGRSSSQQQLEQDGLGKGGSSSSRKDVLQEKRQELLDLEAEILKEQQKVLAGPDTGNFIVLFKTPQAANLAAHSTVYPDTGQGEPFKVQPAPSPEDVLWPSLWATPADRRSVLGIVSFWYSILYLIPTGFFAASLNAVNLTMCSHTATGSKSFEWFCASKFLQFLVTIVAPYILLIVWQNAVIPAQMYRLELRRGVAVSLSQMERRLLLVYCGWELTNIFLGGVLSGSLVSQVQVFFKNPEQWAQVLGAAIPQTSNFFLNYVITRAFMLNLVRLLMPHGGMWRWIGQMLFTGFTGFRHAATASYRACIIYPASIRYGREPGLVLLILLIGMAYCVAAPLITVFVFAYMVTAYIVWRYQIIYVCVRAYESGGKMWPTYFLCIEYCLAFFVAFTSSMLIFKKANIQGVVVLLLLPMLYIFNRRCRIKYQSKVDHPPLWLAHAAPRSEIDPLVYSPPCLQPNAQGWFFEAGKPWIRWGVPSYNNPKKPGHDDGGCCC